MQRQIIPLYKRSNCQKRSSDILTGHPLSFLEADLAISVMWAFQGVDVILISSMFTESRGGTYQKLMQNQLIQPY